MRDETPTVPGIPMRIIRLSRLCLSSFLKSPRLRDKLALCRCLFGYLCVRLKQPGKPQEVYLRFHELRLLVDVSRGEISSYWEIWEQNEYEAMASFRGFDATCIVDIGGNIGCYAIRQGLRARHGRILTFEPTPSVFRRLKYNIENNNLVNVIPIHAAISDKNGTVFFEETPLSINCRVVSKQNNSTITVPCETLDHAMERLGVESIDILKVDTEGHEKAVFMGATKTLPRVERVVVEIHNDFRSEKKVIDAMLEPFGFRAILRYGALVYYEREHNK